MSIEGADFSDGRFMSLSGVVRPYYHVTDHLGSVRTVIDGQSGQVVERNDYYPFGGRWEDSGSEMMSANRYRYNGKEEQSGEFGVHTIDYGARHYTPISGRWLSMDPLAEKYYSISPYVFCNNNPVNYVDLDGMRIVITNNSIEYQWKEVEGVWGFYDEDNNQIKNNLFVDMASSYLSELMATNTGSSLVQELVEHSESIYIGGGKNVYDSSTKTVGFNSIHVKSVTVEGGINSDFSATFIHELAHALYDISGGETKLWFTVPQGENYKVVKISEIFTTHVENKFRAEKELPLRTYYAKNEYNQPYGPPIIAPGTRQSRYYKSDGTTNYKILKRNETPYEY